MRFLSALFGILLVSCSPVVPDSASRATDPGNPQPVELVPASVSRAIDSSKPQQVENYRQLAEAALADKDNFYDQRLDSITTALHGVTYDEGIRTMLTGPRDRAAQFFKANQEKAAELIRVGSSTPDRSIDPVLLATWTVIAAEVDHLTPEQRQMTEGPEDFESR